MERRSLLLLIIGFFSLSTPAFATDKSIITQQTSCLCQKMQRSSAKFAEVEILLSPKFDLAYISALPRAPGSDLKILENPQRAVAQLTADKVKNLLDEGAEIRVLRNFILVQDAQSGSASDGSVSAEAGCSGDYIWRQNKTDVPLKHIPGFKMRAAFSDIIITDAPANARTKCVDVGFSIYHSFPLDLVVLLDSESDCSYTLFDGEFELPGFVNRTRTNISACNGEPVNQTWSLIAGSMFSKGYIDSWWIKVYYEKVSPPSNDDCGNAISVQEAIPYKGSTVGATGADEGGCGDVNDVNDVWHYYTPDRTGLVTISLEGSTFDTTLTVFDRCGGTELACSDDSCETLYSIITMLMTAGDTYLIRISGFEFEQGDYTLTVTASLPIVPTELKARNPVSDAIDVPVNAVLSWNCSIARASQTQSNNADATASKNTIHLETIFGKDDRLDEYEVVDPNILTTGDATAVLVPRELLSNNNDGTFSLPSETFSQLYLQYYGRRLCPDEPFRNQPAPGLCSGFLVASDIIVTAGHCACPQDYSDRALVFGFVMRDANTAVLKIPESEIYYCKEVIARCEGDPDWGLIRLDRNVTGHNPLPLRHAGIIPDGEPLLVIGYPWGMPRKYAAGAIVRDNTTSAYFLANLDTQEGNSGSAVLNANTLVVEGIIYAGPVSFEPVGRCDISFVCPDAGCPDWPYMEYVTRSTEFSPLIPLFDVYLGTNPDQLRLIHSDIVVQWYNSGPLQTMTTYYWKVVAKNCYGQTESPVWSFTTVR